MSRDLPFNINCREITDAEDEGVPIEIIAVLIVASVIILIAHIIILTYCCCLRPGSCCKKTSSQVVPAETVEPAEARVIKLFVETAKPVKPVEPVEPAKTVEPGA